MRGAPQRNQRMQRRGIVAGLDTFAQGAVAEHLCNFRKYFKVLLRRSLGHQQKNKQVHGLLIRRIETNRRLQLKNGSHRGLQPFDAAMRYRYAMAQAGGTKALTGKQTVRDERPVQAVLILEQQARFFERALLARRFNADHDLGGGQYLRKPVHNDL